MESYEIDFLLPPVQPWLLKMPASSPAMIEVPDQKELELQDKQALYYTSKCIVYAKCIDHIK